MRLSGLLFSCAVALSATAAYYSIVGLATIFSGAYFAVIIMASILEISKLVIASWLYQKWNEVSGLIRTYLTASVVVLMLITSLGIFGFLSKAHVEQGLANTAMNLRIEQIDQQLHHGQEVVHRYRAQLEQLDRTINIQLDNNRATQALAARQRQAAERDQIRQRLDAEQERLAELQRQRIQLQQQLSVLASEVGPIRYVAELFLPPGSVDLEQAVRWMIVVLVLVFDPLAVLMLIAANMSLARERKNALAQEEPVTAPDSSVPPARPLGDILLVDGRPMRWWNGQSWERFDEPDDLADSVVSRLDARVLYIADQLKGMIPDASAINAMVKASMDEWLTQASVASQIEDKPHDTDARAEPNEEIPEDVKAPVAGTGLPPETPAEVVQKSPTTQEAKPSWL